MPIFDLPASSLSIAAAMPMLALVVSLAALSRLVVVRAVRPVRVAPSRVEKS